MINKVLNVSIKILSLCVLVAALNYFGAFSLAAGLFKPKIDPNSAEGRDKFMKEVISGTVKKMGFRCAECEWYKHIGQEYISGSGNYEVFLATCDAKPYTIKVIVDRSEDRPGITAQGAPGWEKESKYE